MRKIEETAGFVICYDGIPDRTDQPPQGSPVPTVPPKPVSDDKWAASCRIEYLTHVLEPVIKNGKETGEWKVYFFRRKRHLDD